MIQEQQPEALRLAYALNKTGFIDSKTCRMLDEAAAELRRLHARVQELEAAQKGDYLDGVNIPRLREALTFLGRGNGIGEGEVANKLSEYVNSITRAVLACKDLLRSVEPGAAQAQRAPLAEPINHAAHRPTFDGKDWFMTEIREMSPQKIGQLYLHWKMYGDFSVEPFAAGVRYAERAHGIGREQP